MCHRVLCDYVLMCQRALRDYMLRRQRPFCAYVLTRQRVLRVYMLTPCVLYVLTWQRALRAYLLTCQRVLCVYMLTPWVLCVLTCQRALLTYLRAITKISFQYHVLSTSLWLLFVFFQWNKTVAYFCTSLTSQKSLESTLSVIFKWLIKGEICIYKELFKHLAIAAYFLTRLLNQ